MNLQKLKSKTNRQKFLLQFWHLKFHHKLSDWQENSIKILYNSKAESFNIRIHKNSIYFMTQSFPGKILWKNSFVKPQVTTKDGRRYLSKHPGNDVQHDTFYQLFLMNISVCLCVLVVFMLSWHVGSLLKYLEQ